MYEYKVLILKVKDAEATMNEYAKKGYRVVSVSPNIATGWGVIVTFEKEV